MSESIVNVICITVVVVCVSIISIISIYRVTGNTKLLIENGYEQVQAVGTSGHYWTKK